jgi:hypothetical protein
VELERREAGAALLVQSGPLVLSVIRDGAITDICQLELLRIAVGNQVSSLNHVVVRLEFANKPFLNLDRSVLVIANSILATLAVRFKQLTLEVLF